METRNCQNCKKDFNIEPNDFGFYEKIGVPAPAWCPDCRFGARMLFRNDRTFYRRACDSCKANIIAVYPADAPFPVYCLKCWWGDGWDPASYGRDFDFSRPFFEQFKELLFSVPALAIMNDNGVASTNCEYTYDWFYSKNGYLNVGGWHTDNVLYSYHIEHNKDILDSMHMRESELTYECLQCYKLGRCAYCTYCSECQDCFMSFDLKGCTNCVMCIGLRNKKYCIKNIEYSKEEYEKKLVEMGMGDFNAIEKMKKEFRDFSLQFPHKFAYILKSENSTGDFIINCKNVKNTFMALNGHNLRFMFCSDTSKDTYDCVLTGKAELCYYSMVADEAHNCHFTVFCMRSNTVDYSQYCPGAEWSFGCVGLKKGSYSILNKKYTKAEYEALLPKIIKHMKTTGEWGQFFPHSVSPFAYNETAVQEFFPLTKEEALEKGYRWRDPDAKDYKPTISPEDLPTSINETKDNIIEEVIACGHKGECNHKCTTAFKIHPNELNLYRKLNIPLPHICPNCRHFERVARRNPIKLWHRVCMKEGCNNEFETSYAPDRPEIVYCEKCYQQEVY